MNTQTGSPRIEVDLEHEHRIARDPSTNEWGILNKQTGRVLFNDEMGKALEYAMACFASIKKQDDLKQSSSIILPGAAGWPRA